MMAHMFPFFDLNRKLKLVRLLQIDNRKLVRFNRFRFFCSGFFGSGSVVSMFDSVLPVHVARIIYTDSAKQSGLFGQISLLRGFKAKWCTAVISYGQWDG